VNPRTSKYSRTRYFLGIQTMMDLFTPKLRCRYLNIYGSFGMQYDDAQHTSPDEAFQANAVSPLVRGISMLHCDHCKPVPGVDTPTGACSTATPSAQEASPWEPISCDQQRYVAPELRARHRLHMLADLYSFGVILWEVMMGAFVPALCALSRSLPSCTSIVRPLMLSAKLLVLVTK
jgi:hypothetical protein